MGDWSHAGKADLKNMFISIKPTPKTKLVHTAGTVTRLLYSPYRYGPRKAPAMAPQDRPMSCAMKAMLYLY